MLMPTLDDTLQKRQLATQWPAFGPLAEPLPPRMEEDEEDEGDEEFEDDDELDDEEFDDDDLDDEDFDDDLDDDLDDDDDFDDDATFAGAPALLLARGRPLPFDPEGASPSPS